MRLRNYTLSPENVAWMIRDTHPGLSRKIEGGPPVGAKVVNAGFDLFTRRFVLTFEHESFAEVPNGAAIPDENDLRWVCVCRVPGSDPDEQVDRAVRLLGLDTPVTVGG